MANTTAKPSLCWYAGGVASAKIGGNLVGKLHILRNAWISFAGDIARFSRAQSAAARVCLLAIVVLGLGLRWASLDQPMRYDESYTYLYFAAHPWTQIVSDYSLPNNHVFFTLLVHLDVGFWGNAPAILRLPSLVPGLALLPATYVAARCFLDEPGALLATGLAATSTALTLYATSARGYSLVCLCFLLLLVLAHYLAGQRNLVAWVLFALIAVIGLYTIPIMIYPLGGAVLWLLVRGWEKTSDDMAEWRALLIQLVAALATVAVLTILLYLPILVSAGPSALLDNGFVAPSSVGAFGSQIDGFVRTLVGMAVVEYTGWGAILLLVPILVALIAPDPPGRALRVAALLIAGWCLVVMLANRHVPYPRVWLFLLPLLGIVASGGVMTILGRLMPRAGAARATLPIALGIAFGVTALLGIQAAIDQPASHAVEPDALHDGPRLAADLTHLLHPGDCILAPVPSDVPLAYYFTRAGFSTAYLAYPSCMRKRLFVVVDGDVGFTLPAVLVAGGVDASRYPPARLVLRYPDADLYLLSLAPTG
jgi:hypothetical protein